MSNARIQRVIVVATIVAFGLVQTAAACPFCTSVAQTFSEEMESMDAVVIARLISLPKIPKDGSLTEDGEIPKAKFEIAEFLKGQDVVKGTTTLEALYFGDGQAGDLFLVMAVDPTDLMWSTPLRLSKSGREYVSKLLSLPKTGAERLKFFMNHLEDKDELLARDAYDEFARAPYEQVIALRPAIDHDQIVRWINDDQIPASRRRLYFTMLGVCGSEADIPMLEANLKSNNRKRKSGLDAMIACYLTLKGAAGLPLIEDNYIKDKDAEYADTYQAIMALRFHGTEVDIIPRKRILQSLHYMLDRPPLADLVIPDLARWEDWTQIEKLVKLFKEADDKSSWVRVPVINYLRVCPLPEASERIKELEKIDPAAVKRANTFYPGGPAAAGSGDEKSSQIAPSSIPVAAADEQQPEVEATVSNLPEGQDDKSFAVASTATVGSAVSGVARPNILVFLGVPVMLGSILMLTMWTLLRGGAGFQRS